MVVGLCEVSVTLRGVRSLKDKRTVMRRLIERTRQKFEVSVSETGENDSLRSGLIGLAVVSNDARYVDSQLDKILQFMREMYVADIVGADREIVHWSGPFH